MSRRARLPFFPCPEGRPRRWSGLLALCAALAGAGPLTSGLVASGGLLLAAGLAAAQETGNAAVVNGAPISVFRLERHFEDYLKEQGRNLSNIRDPRVYKRLKREALFELIDRQLLWEAAQARQITVSEGDLDAAMARAESAFRGRDAFLRRLRAAGFDAASYRGYLMQIMAGQLVLASLVDSELAARNPEADAAAREAEFRAIYRQARAQIDPQGTLGEEAGARLVAEQILVRERQQADKAVRERLRAAARIELLLSL